MHCRMFRSNIGHYSLDDGSMTTKNAFENSLGIKLLLFKNCQVIGRGKKEKRKHISFFIDG